MSARPKFDFTIRDAAAIAYAHIPGWRQPPTDEIERQRAIEAREDARREADEYTTDSATNWEGE